MKTAMNLFEQGFNRTNEKSFEQGRFKIDFEGGCQFCLSDARTNQALIRFQKESSMLPGQPPRLVVVDKGHVSREQYRALDAVAQRGEMVRGSSEAEFRHAQKSRQIAELATGLAEAMGSTDYQGKHYRIQISQDSLKISANDGRGEVYRREGAQVVSRFEQKDFGRFAQALQTLEPVTRQARATVTASNLKTQVALE